MATPRGNLNRPSSTHVEGWPSAPCDCRYLVARKKAAVLAAGPPRIYLPPQEVSDTVTLHYRADRMAAKPA